MRRTASRASTRPATGGGTATSPIGLRLVAKSSADDTDWYAKLADVAPDGTETLITEGALRASHRALDPARSRPERPYHPHTGTTPIEPGRYYDYDVEIWPTAWELAAGHRLQLRLTSSDLPTHLPGSFVFDKDDPTSVSIDLNDPATNTIRLGASSLLLPVSRASTAGTGPRSPSSVGPEATPRPAGTLPATGNHQGTALLCGSASLLFALISWRRRRTRAMSS